LHQSAISNQQSKISNLGRLLLQGKPLVDFSNGKLDLLLSHRMLCRFSLLLEVGLGEAKRFELSDFLRIDFRAAAGALPPLGFPLFDLFLDACFCVYEAFSGITHK
jgi:hypothetical protein